MCVCVCYYNNFSNMVQFNIVEIIISVFLYTSAKKKEATQYNQGQGLNFAILNYYRN